MPRSWRRTRSAATSSSGRPTSTITAGGARPAVEPGPPSTVEVTRAPGQPAQQKAAHALDHERDLGLRPGLGELDDLLAPGDHVEDLPSVKGDLDSELHRLRHVDR